MEKKMETTIMGYIGATSFLANQLGKLWVLITSLPKAQPFSSLRLTGG